MNYTFTSFSFLHKESHPTYYEFRYASNIGTPGENILQEICLVFAVISVLYYMYALFLFRYIEVQRNNDRRWVETPNKLMPEQVWVLVYGIAIILLDNPVYSFLFYRDDATVDERFAFYAVDAIGQSLLFVAWYALASVSRRSLRYEKTLLINKYDTNEIELNITDTIKFYIFKIGFGALLFTLRMLAIGVKFTQDSTLVSVSSWSDRDQQIVIAASLTYLIVIVLWTFWWMKGMLKTWRLLKQVSYAHTRPIQLAFGFFSQQSFLSVPWFVMEYMILFIMVLFHSNIFRNLNSQENLANICSIVFRQQTNLFGKVYYLTVHMLVLLFAFLPVEQHENLLQLDFVYRESDMEVTVTNRQKALEAAQVEGKQFWRALSFTTTDRSPTPTSTVFCVELAIFLRDISSETYYDPACGAEYRIVSGLMDAHQDLNIVTDSSLTPPTNDMQPNTKNISLESNYDHHPHSASTTMKETDNSVALFRTLYARKEDKDFMSIEQFHCELLAAIHHPGQTLTCYVFRHLNDPKLIVSFRGTSGGIDSPNALTDLDFGKIAIDLEQCDQGDGLEKFFSQISHENANNHNNTQTESMKRLNKLNLKDFKSLHSERGGTSGKDVVTATLNDVTQICVHRGFWKAYLLLRRELHTVIRSFLREGDRLLFTGHSLGGALATLAAVDILNHTVKPFNEELERRAKALQTDDRQPESQQRPVTSESAGSIGRTIRRAVGSVLRRSASDRNYHINRPIPSADRRASSLGNFQATRKLKTVLVTMYNFGSPRVGNANFTDYYSERVPDSFRVVADGDIVPSLPYTWLRFKHVPTLVIVDPEGQGSMIIDPSLIERKLRTRPNTSIENHKLIFYKTALEGVLGSGSGLEAPEEDKVITIPTDYAIGSSVFVFKKNHVLNSNTLPSSVMV